MADVEPPTLRPPGLSRLRRLRSDELADLLDALADGTADADRLELPAHGQVVERRAGETEHQARLLDGDEQR